MLNLNKFKLIGGEVGLDFVNTVSGWFNNPQENDARDYRDAFRGEKLDLYADLLAWSVRTKLLSEEQAKRLLLHAEKNPAEAEKVLLRARFLRESVYRLFKSAIQNWEPETADLERLNQELALARRHERIVKTQDGFGYEWTDAEDALDFMLWQIAESVAQTLMSSDLTRIRQCVGEECGWMFFDTSRNRSRHWCDMRECGNLAKVRRFRQKNSRQ